MAAPSQVDLRSACGHAAAFGGGQAARIGNQASESFRHDDGDMCNSADADDIDELTIDESFTSRDLQKWLNACL